MQTNPAQSSTCAEAGGGGSLALNTRTGLPEYEPKLILLNLEFEDWWAMHGEEDHPGAVGLTLRYHRSRQLEECPPTEKQAAEDSSETRCPMGFSVDPIVLPPDWK